MQSIALAAAKNTDPEFSVARPVHSAPFMAQLIGVHIQGLGKNPLKATEKYEQRQFPANTNPVFLRQSV